METTFYGQSGTSFPLDYLCNIPTTRNPKEAAILNMYKQKELLL